MRLLQVIGGPRPYFGASSALVFLLIFAGGCRKDEKPTPVAAPPPVKDFHAGLAPQAGTLDGQLASEAAARVNDAETITIEEVIGSLADGGLAFGGVRQAMGRKQLAIYCASADGPDGVVLSVCEYPSAEAALNGQREVDAFGSKVAGHVSRVRKKSVLHLIKKSTTPDETVQKIFAAFDAA